MKKVIFLTVAGVLSFVLSTAGIYLAMPSIAPAIVHETNMRLDSLGLVPRPVLDSLSGETDEGHAVEQAINSSVADTRHEPADTAAGDLPSPEAEDLSDGVLVDSLQRSADLITHLRGNNTALLGQVNDLAERLDSLLTSRIEAAELGASLAKLEDKQLGNILASLELDVVETLYSQASTRERSRLLQHLPPDRAARFVKILMRSGEPADETVDATPIGDEPESETPNL